MPYIITGSKITNGTMYNCEIFCEICLNEVAAATKLMDIPNVITLRLSISMIIEWMKNKIQEKSDRNI